MGRKPLTPEEKERREVAKKAYAANYYRTVTKPKLKRLEKQKKK